MKDYWTLHCMLVFGIHKICSAELPSELTGELLFHDVEENIRHYTEKYSLSNHYKLRLRDILGAYDPDARRNVSELISSKGYPYEEYSVTTEDGYIVSLQRIPHGLHESFSTTQQKPPVFLMHGFLASSADFVLNFPNQSLGFILADAGFDVWLGNARGNTYSKRHVSLSTESKEFWEFSFDETALYDLPAMIDFILQKTNQEQLSYIGHSVGTTILYCLLSEKLKYNNKINIGIHMGPIGSCKHSESDGHYVARVAPQIKEAYDLIGVYEFSSSSPTSRTLYEILCKGLAVDICEGTLYLFNGHYMAQRNDTRFHVYMTHTPAGTSTQNFVHFCQLFDTDKLLKQDFGEEMNLQKYGMSQPPEYDLSKITAPMVLFSANEDLLADPTDVKNLAERLKNSFVDSITVQSPFTHLDFAWGVKANQYLYQKVLYFLRKFAV